MQLQINNLEFSYEKNTDLIKDFNLQVKKGEIIALVGRSGSGKSTILRLISGLEVPDKGEIKLNGEILVDKNEFLVPEKRKIGMLFQNYALFPHLTVYQNISFGIENLKRNLKDKRVKKLLELIDLKGYEKRYPHQLSGGEKQRIALARTLAINPKLLLLDEPFSNLDTELKEGIRSQLKNIIEKVNITTILVSHDKKNADFMANREIIID